MCSSDSEAGVCSTPSDSAPPHSSEEAGLTPSSSHRFPLSWQLIPPIWHLHVIIKLILIICEFRACEFTYLPKYTRSPQINIMALLGHLWTRAAVKNLSPRHTHFPDQALTKRQVSFCGVFRAISAFGWSSQWSPWSPSQCAV